MPAKSKLRGRAGFIDYYRNSLEILSAQTKPILRIRPGHEQQTQQAWQAAGLPWRQLDWYDHAVIWPETVALGTPLPGYAEHWFYPMNASSLKPVLALQPQAGEYILDACAAPGGKALFIADLLGLAATLTANDPSPARRQRLRQLLNDYHHTEVSVTPNKAEIIFKHQPHYYDAILLDAPCSSEKHVWNDPRYLTKWSFSRIERLQQQQIALLNGLWLALKPDGRLIYATCAINTLENEAVMADFQRRHPEAIIKEQTKITPDRTLYDPMFFAIVQRV